MLGAELRMNSLTVKCDTCQMMKVTVVVQVTSVEAEVTAY